MSTHNGDIAQACIEGAQLFDALARHVRVEANHTEYAKYANLLEVGLHTLYGKNAGLLREAAGIIAAVDSSPVISYNDPEP